MYGLLLEGIRQFICSTYGLQAWTQILEKSKLDVNVFAIHEVYDEELLKRIVFTAADYCRITKDELMFQNGKYFISFLSHYGYDSILRVLGRDLRDFLNGLDNLHEYLRFSYPKLKPPSFFCVNESRTGITLQYRTQRAGFVHYVRGQIFEIAKTFYNTTIEIEIIGENKMPNKVFNCILRLKFDNQSFKSEGDNMSIPSELFFEVFPFNIVFNRGLRVVNCGRGMRNLIPDIIGDYVGDVFHVNRPIIQISWDTIILHSNNVFELILLHIKKSRLSDSDSSNSLKESNYRLRMRGQMKYMNEWDAIVFLGTPIMRDVESMWKAGLYINDLSMHDSSRDLVLAGEQQSAELRLALEQESEKSKRLEDSLKRLDDEMRRTDELLYQMIPRAVANRLRNGEKSVNTCETFNEVTILFSDVVGFTKICSNITPLDVVEMLNSMYSVFDQLTERHKVYKVETVGDAYMIASGCPVLTTLNAPLIAEMALEMIDKICTIKNPANEIESLKIRVGIHTGTVVAGVVGIKMPRYCLFGDTVNTASRMESTGETQKIQISSSTQKKLMMHNVYQIVERGVVEVKGKGNVSTYWLEKHLDKQSLGLLNYMETVTKERERLGDANMSTYQSHGEYWHELSLSRCSSVSVSHSRTGSHKGNHSKDDTSSAKTFNLPNGCRI